MTPETDTTTYYYADASARAVGPYSVLRMRELFDSGTINAETLVIPWGGKEWRPWSAWFQPVLIEAAPSAEVQVNSDATHELAGVFDRFCAWFINVGLAFVPYFFVREMMFGTNREPSEASILVARFALIVAMVVLTVIQLVLLSRTGQDIGKRILGLRIVREDNHQNGGFVTNVVMRLWLGPLAGLVLVDALFIFGKKRRCIHDLIAGTIVIC